MKIFFLVTIIFLVPSVVCCMETQSETPLIYFVHFTMRPREGASVDGELPTHVHTFKKVGAPDHITKAGLEIITLKKDSTSANILLTLVAKTFDQHPILPYSQLQPILTTEPFKTITENKESNALIVYLDSIYDIMGATTGQQIIDWSSPLSQESGYIEFNQETKSKAIALLTTTLNMRETQPNIKKTNLLPAKAFPSKETQKRRHPHITRNIWELVRIGVVLFVAGYICIAGARLLLYQMYQK